TCASPTPATASSPPSPASPSQTSTRRPSPPNSRRPSRPSCRCCPTPTSNASPKPSPTSSPPASPSADRCPQRSRGHPLMAPESEPTPWELHRADQKSLEVLARIESRMLTTDRFEEYARGVDRRLDELK